MIDISTFGSFQANDSEEMEMQFLMLREGVVETVSTDYGGGAHDPMLVVLEKAIARHCLDLPTAIALVTNNVAHAVPLLAPNRGIVAEGKEADLAIIDKEHISQVDTVIIGGRIAVEHGQLAKVLGEEAMGKH